MGNEMRGNEMHMVNSFDPSRPADLGDAARDLLRRRDASMGAAYRLFYDRPLHLVRGEGAYLFDSEGNDYLDAYNNVPVVGHSNPRVRQAVSEQLGTLNTHTRYLTDQVVAYAERLTGLFPSPLDQAIFACTGSEAVDLALRVARAVTGRRGVIATRHAYHGTTTATAEVSPSLGSDNPHPGRGRRWSTRRHVRDDPATAAEEFGRRIDAAVEELEDVASSRRRSCLGLGLLQRRPAARSRGPAQVARRTGPGRRRLYLADEVEAGSGARGAWWGFQLRQRPCSPDLVVLGKPMGNGLPIAALVSSRDLLDTFGARSGNFNTSAGTRSASPPRPPSWTKSKAGSSSGTPTPWAGNCSTPSGRRQQRPTRGSRGQPRRAVPGRGVRHGAGGGAPGPDPDRTGPPG